MLQLCVDQKTKAIEKLPTSLKEVSTLYKEAKNGETAKRQCILGPSGPGGPVGPGGPGRLVCLCSLVIVLLVPQPDLREFAFDLWISGIAHQFVQLSAAFHVCEE